MYLKLVQDSTRPLSFAAPGADHSWNELPEAFGRGDKKCAVLDKAELR